jgi:hypothetical protein
MSNDGMPISNQPVVRPPTDVVDQVRETDAINRIKPEAERRKDEHEQPKQQKKSREPDDDDPLGHHIDELA